MPKISTPKPGLRKQIEDTLFSVTPRELLELRQEITSDVPEPDEGDRASTVEDIQRTGEVANMFLAGLDKVTDVLLILVLKFGRATSLLVTVLLFTGIACGFLIWAVTLLYDYRIEQADLVEQVRGIQNDQAELLEQLRKVEDAPKVVVDDEGQPQLVISSEKPSEAANTSGKSPDKRGSVSIPLGVQLKSNPPL